MTNTNEQMDVSRVVRQERRPLIGQDLIYYSQKTDYQTVWQASFCPENEIDLNTQFNMI